jgi:cation diffusion facilitator family transporter
MLNSVAMRATLVGIAANALLLVVKAVAAHASDSLTILSEVMNSLSDLVAAIVILLCVRWAWMRPDHNHPFGHRRAEPIAGMLVAIFTGILGFEVCRAAVTNLWRGEQPEVIGPLPIVALMITAGAKAWLAVYFVRRARRLNSPALRATFIDCRNDVLVAGQGLIAVILAQYQLRMLDTVSALIIGLYILYSAYRVGMENIDYLMGKAPARDLLRRIQAAAEQVREVKEVDHVMGHYVGTFVHVELTARVDGLLSTADSHEVAEMTRVAVEAIENVDRAFVHIEPLPGRPKTAASTE